MDSYRPTRHWQSYRPAKDDRARRLSPQDPPWRLPGFYFDKSPQQLLSPKALGFLLGVNYSGPPPIDNPPLELGRIAHIFNLIHSISTAHFAADIPQSAAHSLIRATRKLSLGGRWWKRVDGLLEIEDVFINARKSWVNRPRDKTGSDSLEQNGATMWVDETIKLRHKIPLTEKDRDYIECGSKSKGPPRQWKRWEHDIPKMEKGTPEVMRSQAIAARKHETEAERLERFKWGCSQYPSREEIKRKLREQEIPGSLNSRLFKVKKDAGRKSLSRGVDKERPNSNDGIESDSTVIEVEFSP